MRDNSRKLLRLALHMYQVVAASSIGLVVSTKTRIRNLKLARVEIKFFFSCKVATIHKYKSVEHL